MMIDAKLVAAQQLHRALCNSPCGCDWTPIRSDQEPADKCARCAALRAWEDAT